MYMLVSNTSTLVLLAKIGLLERFFDTVAPITIPSQVRIEYSFDEASYYAKLLEKAVLEKKIIVKEVRESELKIILHNFRLDSGEAAVYVLYKKGGYTAILTDDGELIKLCKLENIPFLCSLAIVVRLYEKRLITKEEAMEKLEKLNTVGRYSKEIYEYFKKEVR